jgi:hypothetical protein
MDDRRTEVRFLAGANRFSLLVGMETGTELTQPPIKFLPGFSCPEVKQLDVKLTIHVKLVPGLRMYGALSPIFYGMASN